MTSEITILMVTDFYWESDGYHVFANNDFDSSILTHPDYDTNNIILINYIFKTAQWRNILWKIESLIAKPRAIDLSYDTYVLVLT